MNQNMLFPNKEMSGKRLSWYMLFVALQFSFILKQNGSFFNALYFGNFEFNDLSNGWLYHWQNWK